MIVEQIWTGNAFRNFNYLIVCPATGEAMAVDPLDYEKCLGLARDRGWQITQVLNTHEHFDHIGGNNEVIEATTIPGLDRGLQAGDVIKIGSTVELEALDTPGHTMSHICLLSHTDQPALFSGDTLFNAGAGNCHNGGHPEELYETFDKQLSKLRDDTLVYPGHDYLINNLRFTLDREPDNEVAKAMILDYEKQDPADALVTTLAQERDMNTFFRLDSPSVIARLREDFPDIGDQPDGRTVFLKLRELRNSW